MKTKIIEACHVLENGREGGNWGKFMLCRFDSEWHARSQIVGEHPFSGGTLLGDLGWTQYHLTVLDLATGEGAIFKPGGYPKADLDKHKIWVCPLFEPFLTWLYQQDLSDLDKLPSLVKFDIRDTRFEMQGHRRQGPRTDTNRLYVPTKKPL